MLPVLKGAFIFVCRQMYSTCEGLEVLLPYQLHESVAEAWKKVALCIFYRALVEKFYQLMAVLQNVTLHINTYSIDFRVSLV